MSDDSTGEAGEADLAPVKATWRRPSACQVLSCCGVLLFLCLVVSYPAIVFAYKIRSMLPDYDARLTFAVRDADPDGVTETAQALERRLEEVGILSRLELGPGEVRVRLRSEDVPRAKALLLRSSMLKLMVVVEEDEVSGARRAELIEALRQRGPDLSAPRYAIYPWHPDAFGAEPGPALLRADVVVEGADFAEVHRASDATGRPCIGFTMSPAGRDKLHRLTSQNIDRRLAIVIDGRIRTAPTIQSPIGSKGIIQGGREGWTERELFDLIALLRAGALPHQVELVREERD